MSKIHSGNILTAPGLRAGRFPARNFVSASSPSCFEEPAFVFSGNDSLSYSIGSKINGQIHQRFNAYQGTLRLIYAPYQTEQYTPKRTIFYLEGVDSESYMTLYLEDGSLYFDVKGVSQTGGTLIRRAYRNLPALTMNKNIHIVARWDYNGKVAVGGNEYYLTLHTNGASASEDYADTFPVLSWEHGNQKSFTLGNAPAGNYSAEGKVYGCLIDDNPWSEAKIVDDYNSGAFRRLSYAVSIDTIFSGPYARNNTVADYNCYGVDKTYILKERSKEGDATSGYFKFQNKNGNVVQDPYMFRADTNKWSENNTKIGKETNPSYVKTGRHSLKVVRAATTNTYASQVVYLQGEGPFSVDFEVYVTQGSKARVKIITGGTTTKYDSGDITTLGWNKVHGSFTAPLPGQFTIALICDSVVGGPHAQIVYYDRIFITPNHIVQPSFETMNIGVVWRELSAGEVHWMPTGFSEGSSMGVYNSPLALSDGVYQLNLVAHNTDSMYLFNGQMREDFDYFSCNPYVSLHETGVAIADRYLIHNFSEVSGLCVDSDWHDFNFTIPAPLGNFDFIFQYGLAVANSTFYLDNLACIELDTIQPSTYFSGTDNYALDRYGTNTGAYLIDGRDVVEYAEASYFINTLSGGILLGFLPNGSWWGDNDEHIFMQYGAGDMIFKKNSSNELEFEYNGAVCTLGVTQMSPTKYQFIGASWDQAEGSISVMGEGSVSVYEGVVPAISAENTFYLGNSNVPTGDASADAYFDTVQMYGLYISTDSWGKVFNHEVFT